MSKSKTTSERTAERSISIALGLVEQGPLSHLRVKALLDKEFQTIHEPAEIWRALMCSGLFVRNAETGYFTAV